MARTNTEHEAFNVAEVCAAIGIGRTMLFKLIADGRLNARKLGRRTIVLRDDLTRFLAALPAQDEK